MLIVDPFTQMMQLGFTALLGFGLGCACMAYRFSRKQQQRLRSGIDLHEHLVERELEQDSNQTGTVK